MTFPALQSASTVTTNNGTAGMSHNINLPATVTAGNLLKAILQTSLPASAFVFSSFSVLALYFTYPGNRWQETFFCASDYRYYVQTMSEWCGKCGVEIGAYCLISNNVHLIAVPESEDGLSQMVNFRLIFRGDSYV